MCPFKDFGSRIPPQSYSTASEGSPCDGEECDLPSCKHRRSCRALPHRADILQHCLSIRNVTTYSLVQKSPAFEPFLPLNLLIWIMRKRVPIGSGLHSFNLFQRHISPLILKMVHRNVTRQNFTRPVPRLWKRFSRRPFWT
jgi:hypothetical protein